MMQLFLQDNLCVIHALPFVCCFQWFPLHGVLYNILIHLLYSGLIQAEWKCKRAQEQDVYLPALPDHQATGKSAGQST